MSSKKRHIVVQSIWGVNMEIILIITGLIISSAVILFVKEKLQNNESDYFESKTESVYKKKRLLTNTELIFYNYLKKLEPEYIILPQINLASIIRKDNIDEPYQTELFRNIDFCIFNEKYEVLLAIEINDNSHKLYRRKIRDDKVRKILRSCNIDLLTYNVNYPNTEESVIERTKATLQNITDKNTKD